MSGPRRGVYAERCALRNAALVADYLAGATFEDCAVKYGITRARAHQIVRELSPGIVRSRAYRKPTMREARP